LKSPYPAMKFEISTGTIYILGYRSWLNSASFLFASKTLVVAF
jgi:hypothetical protein